MEGGRSVSGRTGWMLAPDSAAVSRASTTSSRLPASTRHRHRWSAGTSSPLHHRIGVPAAWRRATAPSGELGLFLVEFSSTPAADEAADMHHALRYAVLRLRLAGTPIRWCSGLLVPAEHRCLCLVEAREREDVVLARDTAALSGARVHVVRPLPDRPPSIHSSGSRGRF